MDGNKVRELLADVQAGHVDVEQAVERLRTMPYDDLGNFARLDVHRGLRQGLPETVFCESKTPEQSAAILARLWEHHDRVLGTRVPPEMAAFIQAQLPDAHYDPTSRLVMLERTPRAPLPDDAPYAMVVCGGTSDLPVAEEAAQTLEFLGHRVERAYDVGVAGLHRLLGELDRLLAADVVIAVAGMEGRAGERRRRVGRQPGGRRADQRGVRGQLRRPRAAAHDAQLVRVGRLRRQHRQRLRRGRLRAPRPASC